MAQRDNKKRLGKKHRQASTRPKKGRAPRATPTTGAVDPRKRKILSTKRAAAEKASRVTKQSPEREKRKTIRSEVLRAKKPAAAARPAMRDQRMGLWGGRRRGRRMLPDASGLMRKTGARSSCWLRRWLLRPRARMLSTLPLIAVVRPAECWEEHAVQPADGIAAIDRGR